VRRPLPADDTDDSRVSQQGDSEDDTDDVEPVSTQPLPSPSPRLRPPTLVSVPRLLLSLGIYHASDQVQRLLSLVMLMMR